MATEELIEKQKLIREGLVEALSSEERCLTCAHMGNEGYTCAHCDADVALRYLTEKGAVLKVEGEMAHCTKELQPSDCTDNCWGCRSHVRDTAGGTAPLIDPVKPKEEL